MNKKDINEIKRRLKKESCTFTRLCGCYVDASKEKVVKFAETFLNLEDEEYYKYLDIAKKVFSGTYGNNLLELPIPLAEEGAGGRQQFFMGLRESKLKNDDLLDRFYDLIIESYQYAGNYLILVFHDAYDVMTKTTDENKLDESEEVYEYLLCAICPVALSKPGLGYRAEENRIGPRIRDWVVGMPDTGFVFPAFSDRSTDIHSLLFYTKDAKEPHSEFMEAGLGCSIKLTATEEKNAFTHIIKHALGPESEGTEEILMDIQEKMNDYLEEQSELALGEDVVLSAGVLNKLMTESGVSDDAAAYISQTYEEQFGEELPIAEHLIDTKALEANAKKKETEELQLQVEELKQEVEYHKSLHTEEEGISDIKTYDVILRVKPEKVSQIKSQMIDGQKCIVIPMKEDEHATVNGVNTTV